MKIVGDMKTPDKDANKVLVAYFHIVVLRLMPDKSAAFYCIGELMAVFGAQVTSPTNLTNFSNDNSKLVYVIHG
jgi:hypothetical protein